MQEIRESFSEVPRFYVELQQQELRTLDVLRKFEDGYLNIKFQKN